MNIKRDAKDTLLQLSTYYPAVVVTGPRQSGKTTLITTTFPKHTYINLEDPSTLASLKQDPKGYLYSKGDQLIIDEAQKFPELFSYLQVEIDQNKSVGRFILSGSQNLSLTEKVSQSLAGRAGYITLLPLSLHELERAKLNKRTLLQQLLFGGYPRIYTNNIPTSIFYGDYLATYIERDVRQIKNIGNMDAFFRFLRLLAGSVGQLFNASRFANDVGVSHTTIQQWFSVLEASYVVFALRPYYQNFGKRVIKMPKVYFYDIGVIAHLLGINSEKELDNHYMKGALFENLVVLEVLKHIQHNRLTSSLYFWCDSNQVEVDLLIDNGASITPVEIKVAKTFSPNFIKSIECVQSQSTLFGHGYVVYNGDELITILQATSLNWRNLSAITKKIQ